MDFKFLAIWAAQGSKGENFNYESLPTFVGGFLMFSWTNVFKKNRCNLCTKKLDNTKVRKKIENFIQINFYRLTLRFWNLIVHSPKKCLGILLILVHKWT